MELEAAISAILIRESDYRSSVHSSMAVDAQDVFDGDFPDPAAQAEALLEICQGDIGEAQRIADRNLRFAKYQTDRLYWSRVGVLLSRQEPTVVLERLARNKLQRRAVRM